MLLRSLYMGRSALVCLLLTQAAWADASADSWPERVAYRLEIGGQVAGRAEERVVFEDDLVVSETSFRIEVARGEVAVSVDLFERFVESMDGVPVEVLTRQKLGTQTLETVYRFEGDEIVVVVGESERRVEAPEGDWMTPHRERSVLREQVRSLASRADGDEDGEVTFEVRGLDLTLGLEPVVSEYRLEAADDPVDVDGETVAASRWTLIEHRSEHTSENRTEPELGAPPATIWLDGDGLLVRSQAEMMGSMVTLVRAEGDDVPRESVAKLPEILTRSFVHPNRTIESPRSLRRGVYVLRAGPERGALLKTLPDDGVQKTEWLAEGVRITVDLDVNPRRDRPLAQVLDPEEFLEPTRYLDFEHPSVQALLDGVPHRDAGAGDQEIAETLRRRVRRHLRDKNLEIVLGTASGAAEARAGDCTEHAMLLAALLRARDIPSRVAVGLIYARHFAGASDIFAYHMWTQAGLEGRWVDLDATLPDDLPFDATHIRFATSAVDGEGVPFLYTPYFEAILGELEIEVVEPREP